jgi:hypothetical protein
MFAVIPPPFVTGGSSAGGVGSYISSPLLPPQPVNAIELIIGSGDK